jgi:mevalonate kinase
MGESLGRILAAVEAACGPIAPVEIEMSADVPVGAGLGSSAALAVATARALLSTKAPREASVDDVTISAAAASEQVYHGNPSGVDHTTSARGGILVYQKGGRPLFRPLAASSLPLVIAQMAPGADTAEMVAAVERRRCAEPEAIGAVLAMLGRLTGLAEGALERADFSRVGRLMDIAHGGLVSLGVSTACLDRGCHAARRAGAWGAKLTGAGGGGCLIAIVDEQRREAVISALESAGAMVCFSTDAGFSGA